MSSVAKSLVAVLLCGLAQSACTDDDGPIRAARCQEICDKRELCDDSTDREDCVDDCARRAYQSLSYVDRLHACTVGDVSCNVAMDEQAVTDCVTDSLRTVPPSPVQSRVCGALGAMLEACDGDQFESNAEGEWLVPTPPIIQDWVLWLKPVTK